MTRVFRSLDGTPTGEMVIGVLDSILIREERQYINDEPIGEVRHYIFIRTPKYNYAMVGFKTLEDAEMAAAELKTRVKLGEVYKTLDGAAEPGDLFFLHENGHPAWFVVGVDNRRHAVYEDGKYWNAHRTEREGLGKVDVLKQQVAGIKSELEARKEAEKYAVISSAIEELRTEKRHERAKKRKATLPVRRTR